MNAIVQQGMICGNWTTGFFELSGEEEFRKGNVQLIRLEDTTTGKIQYVPRVGHPSPHKGVLVFNGPTSAEFNKRSSTWLGFNEEEFAKKRNFCVMSFSCLLAWHERISASPEERRLLWQLIHDTAGILPTPD